MVLLSFWAGLASNAYLEFVGYSFGSILDGALNFGGWCD